MPFRSAFGRLGIAVLAGLVWAQVSIWLAIVVVPRYLAYDERVAAGTPHALVSWTLLAPWTLARSLGVSAHVSFYLCPLAAVAVCLAITRGLTLERWRTAVAFGVFAALATGVISAAFVAMQVRDAMRAEEAFFALVGSASVPHKDAAVVRNAREFVERHPDSRWCGEAVRIVAMAEWDAGHFSAASDLWRRFEMGFRDPLAPGVAFAEYSLGLCDERLGRRAPAEGHLRNAVGIIRARGDGIQAWIARDCAAHLAGIERSQGLVALADYWKTKSMTFANVYSIQ